MAVKSYDEMLRDIHNKIYYPVYLLQGDEPYYIDRLSEIIEKDILGDMEKEFNQTVIYGRDCEMLSLISTAKRYPMMSNYQVVVVREAQEIKPTLGTKSADDDKDPLAAYILNPVPSTLLVFCFKYKNIDKRTKLYKAIEKHGVVYESKKIYDNKVHEWIEKHLSELGYKIQPKAANLMADSLGNDLSRVANECEKLLINLKKGETIDMQHIETNIGISKDFNIFELQDAIGQKNALKATRIVNYFRSNPKSNPFPVSMANLYSYFSKLLLYNSLSDKSQNAVAAALKVNPFFVKDYEKAAKNYSTEKLISIIKLLRDSDLKSKGVGSTNMEEGELLRELVYKIMH